MQKTMTSPNQIFHKIDKLIKIVTRWILRRRLIVIVATPHKVGSTWLFEMLKDLGHFQSKKLPENFRDLTDTILTDDPQLFNFLKKLNGFYIFKGHSYPITYPIPENLNQQVKFITMIRDPRDVIISASFYLSWLEEEKGGWGEKFKNLTESERLITLIKKGDFLLSRLEEWHRTSIAYVVRYEDIKENPLKELKSVGNYLGLKFKESAIENIVQKYSFKSKSGRSPGEENKDKFLRKGIIGDWKNYFNEDCISAFKSEKEGRWNNLLIEMGYEEKLDW